MQLAFFLKFMIPVYFLVCTSFLYGDEIKKDEKYHEFVNGLIALSAPLMEDRNDRILYEWKFLEHTIDVVSDDLLVFYLQFFRERNLLRHARDHQNRITLDRPLAINRGRNWFFAWRFEPDQVCVTNISKKKAVTIIEIEELLKPGKIYAGYSGLLQLETVTLDGRIILTNVIIDRVGRGRDQRIDLKTYLTNLTSYMRKERLKIK